MPPTNYRGRRAYALDNGELEIIITAEGGHIASMKDKASGINPLWSPPWPTIDPSGYDPAKHPEYGHDAESKLLAGILGHNVCIDLFGGPSEAEAKAGMTVHGEASIATYEVSEAASTLTQTAVLQEAQLRFTRKIQLAQKARAATITETVENLSALDRPIAWTQHATLGPPFLEKGQTRFEVTATKSKVIENDSTNGKGHMKIAAEFGWPMVPCLNGKTEDLRIYTNRSVSAGFTTHLMDPASENSFFVAWNPRMKLAFGYIWRQQDFPWLGIWEENYSRTQPPWNGKTLTRGMEFGVSPYPESRRAMIERGSLFGIPSYRWIPAHESYTAEYKVFLIPAEKMPNPETLIN